MRKNAIGLIVTGIMLLGTAFVYAWNHFEGFRKAIIKGLQIIVNGVGYLLHITAKELEEYICELHHDETFHQVFDKLLR